MKTNSSVVTRSPKRKLHPAALPSRKRQALASLDNLAADALKHRMRLRPRSRSVSPTESGVKKRKKKPSPPRKKASPPPFIIRPDSPVDARSSDRMILRPKQKSPPQPSPTEKPEERPVKIPAPVDARASEIPPSPPRKKAPPPPFIVRPDSPADARASDRMILRPKQKSPPQPSPTENQEERPEKIPAPVDARASEIPPSPTENQGERREKIPAPVDARASEIPPPPTEKQEKRRELGITTEQLALGDSLLKLMKLRQERLRRLTREHAIPMKGFTVREAHLCRYIMKKREWELGDTIPDNKMVLKERLDKARETKGYGVKYTVTGVDGKSFFPLMSDLGKGGDRELKRKVKNMIDMVLLHVNKREMEQGEQKRYTSAGVDNLVKISRHFLLTLRLRLDQKTRSHPTSQPLIVEALFFRHPASIVPIELKEWKMKEGSVLLFCSGQIKN